MNSSKEIISLIKRLREDKKMSVETLAKKVGIAKSTLSRYENQQRDFPINDIGKYADALGVTVELLLGLERPSNLIPINSDLVKVPVLGEIACGEPILAIQNIEEYVYEPADSLPNGDIFALKAKGDSMEPTIPNGAIVLVREQNEVEYGEIAAVLVNGDTEATLKRLKRQGNTVFLMPDNPKHEPYIVDEQNLARIIGKAISFKVTF